MENFDNTVILIAKKFPDSFLNDDGIWLRALIQSVCNLNEIKVWNTLLKKKSKIRDEWLLGRIAAKEAVKRHCQSLYGLNIYLHEIEISHDVNGKPLVIAQKLEKQAIKCEISISHSNNNAIAAVVPFSEAIGIDIEFINDIKSDLDIIFDASEINILNTSINGKNRILFFSAKESASKSLGISFLSDVYEWKVFNIDDRHNVITILYRDILLRVHFKIFKDYLITLCRHSKVLHS